MGSLPPPSASLPAPPRFETLRDPREESYERPHYRPAWDGDRGRPDYDAPRRRDDRGPPPPRSPEAKGRRRLYDRENRSIEERIQLERPCRTLFVRNVQYEADPDALRKQFETYGQIKNYYEMIHNRGMIFITYHDLRAAQRARDAMHGTQLNRRPIDVHYSLPRSDEISGACDGEKNQGTVLVVFHPPRPLDINEVGRMAGQYGDVKDVVPGRVPSEVIVEYYDSRAPTLFIKTMDRQQFMGGELELRYMWDKTETQLPPPPPVSERYSRPPPQSYDDRSRDPAPRHGGIYGAPRNERFEPRGGPRERSPDYGRRGSYGSDYGGPPAAGRYSNAPPAAPVQEDRLAQALKVQQLLNTLGTVNLPPSYPSPSMPPPMNGPPYQSAPAPSHGPAPAYPAQAVRPPSGSYPPPAASPYPPYPTPPTSGFTPRPSPATFYPPYPPPPAPAPAGRVPPQIMGMLSGAPPQQAGPPAYSTPPVLPPANYGAPSSRPPGPPGSAPAAPIAAKDVGSLLAMLQGKPQ